MKFEYVDLNKIKVSPDRIRTTIEKTKELKALKESILVLGLLNPISLDKDYNLIAGFRRFTAYQELKMSNPMDYDKIPANIFEDFDEYKKLKAEIDENLERKELSTSETKKAKSKLRILIEGKGDYQTDVDAAKAKEDYEQLHPETIQGANIVKGEKDYQTKEDIVKKSLADQKISAKRYETVTPVFSQRIEPAQRFTESIAKELGVSERVVQDRVQVGKAILDGDMKPDILEQYKKGKIAHSKVLQSIRQSDDKKKEKGKGCEHKTVITKVKKLLQANKEHCSLLLFDLCTDCKNKLETYTVVYDARS